MNLFYGVVENNWDPEMLGRVQVRIVGKHTENRADPTLPEYLPVEDLPWAQTMQTGSTISNQGNFAIPLNGSVVIVSFMDEEEQKPVILGSVPKLPETMPDFTQGFTDPTGVNPTAESIGVSPISNYATGNPPPQGVINKANDAEIGVVCVDNIWNEPVTPFAPVYPSNLVIQQGEQVFELDATPFAERINFQHIIGAFMEIHPDGTRVTKTKSDDVLVVEGDRNILVKGGSNVTVRGISSGYNLEATRSIKMKSVTENIEMEAPLQITVDTDGILTINAATALIDVTGACIISASLITLN
jgi:hypothetical protein